MPAEKVPDTGKILGSLNALRIVDDDRDSSTDGMPKAFDLSMVASRKKPILDFYGTGKAMEFGAPDR